MKTTQYQPFWLLKRVLFLSHYWYQKEYLDTSEDHSIANFLSVGKSTLFVSLLVSKRVFGYKWRPLNINHFEYWKSTLFVSILASKRVLRYKWRPLNSQLFEYWKEYSICSLLVKITAQVSGVHIITWKRTLIVYLFTALWYFSHLWATHSTVGLIIINDFLWKQ